MAKLSLRVALTGKSTNGKEVPVGYLLAGFECQSTGLVLADRAVLGRWRLFLAPPGQALRRIPQAFVEPQDARRFAQAWLDERVADPRIAAAS
jgi:hypothetical protein